MLLTPELKELLHSKLQKTPELSSGFPFSVEKVFEITTSAGVYYAVAVELSPINPIEVPRKTENGVKLYYILDKDYNVLKNSDATVKAIRKRLPILR